jgi:hypothetical protein
MGVLISSVAFELMDESFRGRVGVLSSMGFLAAFILSKLE